MATIATGSQLFLIAETPFFRISAGTFRISDAVPFFGMVVEVVVCMPDGVVEVVDADDEESVVVVTAAFTALIVTPLVASLNRLSYDFSLRV